MRVCAASLTFWLWSCCKKYMSEGQEKRETPVNKNKKVCYSIWSEHQCAIYTGKFQICCNVGASPLQHEKEKPWDHDGIDHWANPAFTKEDNPNGLLEESSFLIMFPTYRGVIPDNHLETNLLCFTISSRTLLKPNFTTSKGVSCFVCREISPRGLAAGHQSLERGWARLRVEFGTWEQTDPRLFILKPRLL